MANLSKVIYINEEDYSTLVGGNTITKNGKTYSYDSNALYVIKNVGPPEYASTAGYANSAGRATGDSNGNSIQETYATKTELAKKINIYYYDTVTDMESSSNHSTGDIAFDYGKEDFYIFDSPDGTWRKIIDVDDISTQYIRLSKKDMTVYTGNSNLFIIEKNTISDVLVNGEFRKDVVIQFNPYLPGESSYDSDYYPIQVHLCPPFCKTLSEWLNQPSWSDYTYIGEIVWENIIHTFSINFNTNSNSNIISYTVYYKSQDIPNKVPVLSGYASNPGLPTTGDSLGEAFGKLNYNILENEEITSKALIDLNNKINTNTGIEGIVYQELVNLRILGKLIPGKFYKITDYTCTTIQTDTQSAGHLFDIIVFALSGARLSEIAWAEHHSGDTYFSNCKLEAWELRYCLDNNTERFSWADTTNGKGVVYWMKDEWENEAPYDFKNIQFKRQLTNGSLDTTSGTDTWCYTFNYWNSTEGASEDFTMHNMDVFALYGQADNVIPCYSNKFGKICNRQTQPFPNLNLILNDNVFLNTQIDGDCCHNNTFGNNCFYNTFGHFCRNNTFGNNCRNNTFGNNCFYNTFGNNCFNNTFGDSCTNNNFSDDIITITVPKGYTQRLIVDSGNRYITLTSTLTPSGNDCLQNIHITSGVNTSYTVKTISHNSLGDTFLTTYKPANSVEISV